MSKHESVVLTDGLSLETMSKMFSSFVESVAEQEQTELTLSDEQKQTLSLFVKGSIEKRDQIFAFLRALESHEKMLREKVKSTESVARRVKRLYNYFRWSLQVWMENPPEGEPYTEIQGTEGIARLRRNPGKVRVVNKDVIPAEYLREVVEYVPDMPAIEAALKRGEIVPGIEISEETKSLVIV